MRRYLLLFACCFAVLPTMAQEAEAPPPDAWETSLVSKLNLAQAGFQNWQEGGVNTVALTTGINGKATRTTDAWTQKHELRLTYGVVKQDTLDFRKAEDLIQLQSSVQYAGGGFFAKFQPTLAGALRTQFAPGFNFDTDPIDGTRTPPVKVSDFFAPATLTQSLGLTYQPADWITQRLGVAAKETVVTIDRFRTLYGLDPDKNARFEMGLEAFTEVDKEIFTNVRYQSKLGLFASFNVDDNPDVLWENLITMKVNAWMNVNFEVVTIYDTNVSEDVQLKEVFSVGIAYTLL